MSKVYIADKETLDSVKQDTTDILTDLSDKAKESTLEKVQESTESIASAVQSISAGGVAPANMRSFTIQAGDGKASIKFLEPEDTVIDNQLLCTWKGVKIVMKEDGYPEDETDGTEIIDCTEAGKYASTAYVYEGLENSKTYYFQAFPYSDYGIYNRNAANRTTCTPQEYILYGFKVDKNDSNPATRVTYTEMAEGKTPAAVDLSTGTFSYGDWSDAWFITENKPYMVKSDGTLDYELDASDYTKKADGTASDVSDTSYDGNAMSLIPLVWLKQWEDDNYEYCNICNIQLDDDYKAYAHMRSDGTIMDYTLLSCFEGSLLSSKIRSIKGQTPCNTQTGTNEITYAQANGDLWYTRSFSQRNLVNMLLMLISCSDDSQTAFGYGYYTSGSSSSPNYLTTGGASDKGQFYGTNATRDYVKVFHIENWWGDVRERIAGCIYDTTGKFKIKMYPTYNTDGTDYTVTDVTISGSSGGYISASSMSEYGRLPKTLSGSDTTYECDGCYYNTSQSNYAIVGGSSSYGFLAGASALDVHDLVSAAAWHIGAALSCEQPLAAEAA